MKKKLIIPAVILLAVILAFFLSNNPSNLTEDQRNKALMQILGRKPNLNPSESPSGDNSFKGKYVSFLYPASAKIYTQTLNGTPVPRSELENFGFDIKDPRIIFVMSVEKLPVTVQNVSDYPGVRLRENQSNIYTKSNVLADSLEGLSFEKKDISGVERSAFFYRGSKVYTFSVQGSDPKEIDKLYKKILLSVKFLQ